MMSLKDKCYMEYKELVGGMNWKIIQIIGL